MVNIMLEEKVYIMYNRALEDDMEGKGCLNGRKNLKKCWRRFRRNMGPFRKKWKR